MEHPEPRLELRIDQQGVHERRIVGRDASQRARLLELYEAIEPLVEQIDRQVRERRREALLQAIDR